MSATRLRSKLAIVVGLVIVGLILIGLVVVGLLGITASRRVAAPGGPEIREVIVEREFAAPMEAPAADLSVAEGVVAQMAVDDLGSLTNRMIIRTADLAVVVEDTETALTQIRGVAAALNGYVANANFWRANDQLRGTVTIRVPAESFDVAMDQMKDLAIRVERENVSAQDVTEEYTDLSARLRNLEATEEELLALLTEVREQTRKAEDVLAVHRELTNIRGQIEQLKGRLQFLERMTALATINVELIPEEEPPIVAEGWKPLRTVRSALRALVDAGQLLVDVSIWLIVFVLPLLLLLLLPLVVIWYVWRRRRRRRAVQESS